MISDFLLTEDSVFFSTRDYAVFQNQLIQAASRSLKRLASKGIITRITKGLWGNPKHPNFNPLGAVPYLLGNEQGYISFLTALHRHGLISQIPTTIQIATTGHSRRVKTPIGTFELFQLKFEMMRSGVQWAEGKAPYRMASPEKALLDTLYLSTRKNRRFAALPEIETEFDSKKLAVLVRTQIPPGPIKKAIVSRIEKLSVNLPGNKRSFSKFRS
jgi:hypothetical protein